MSELAFKQVHHYNGTGVAHIQVTHADTHAQIGFIVPDPVVRGTWIFWAERQVMYTEQVSKELTTKLQCMNKPAFDAPSDGYYKCVACGVLVPIKDDTPYKEQAACPDHHCDGQVFCNEYKGWNNAHCH